MLDINLHEQITRTGWKQRVVLLDQPPTISVCCSTPVRVRVKELTGWYMLTYIYAYIYINCAAFLCKLTDFFCYYTNRSHIIGLDSSFETEVAEMWCITEAERTAFWEMKECTFMLQMRLCG